MKSKSKTVLFSNLSKLSKLTIENSQLKYFSEELSKTLKVVENLERIDTKDIRDTFQIIDHKNVFRQDAIEKDRILSQSDALKNAKCTHKGYFVSEYVFENK